MVGYRTFDDKFANLRIPCISMENLGHEIEHSLYTAAQNLGITPMTVSSKDVVMLSLLWHD